MRGAGPAGPQASLQYSCMTDLPLGTVTKGRGARPGCVECDRRRVKLLVGRALIEALLVAAGPTGLLAGVRVA